MLGDVGGEFAEGGGDERSGVEEESAVGGEGAGGEDVEEGGFSGAAGAHHGQDLGGEGGQGDVFEDVGWWGHSLVFIYAGSCYQVPCTYV